MTTDVGDTIPGSNTRMTYKIVLYNNYICLLTHIQGVITDGGG